MVEGTSGAKEQLHCKIRIQSVGNEEKGSGKHHLSINCTGVCQLGELSWTKGTIVK